MRSMGKGKIMAKKIPEKYISGGMFIAFLILMGFIGHGIWSGAQWKCVEEKPITKVWEDKIVPSNSSTKVTSVCTHLVRE